MPVRVYIEEAGSGLLYRVYDVRFADHKRKRLPLGDPSANYRIFVAESGVRRLHHFGRGDEHGIREDELERQLHSAGYAQTGKPFDGSELTPDRGQR